MPDLADPQIGVVADWMGHPAPEVEAKVARRPDRGARRRAGRQGGPRLDDDRHGLRRPAVRRRRGLWTRRGRRSRRASTTRVRRCRPTCASQVGPAASTTGWVFEYALTDPARVSVAARPAALPGRRPSSRDRARSPASPRSPRSAAICARCASTSSRASCASAGSPSPTCAPRWRRSSPAGTAWPERSLGELEALPVQNSAPRPAPRTRWATSRSSGSPRTCRRAWPIWAACGRWAGS